jgi:hypothetical protein
VLTSVSRVRVLFGELPFLERNNSDTRVNGKRRESHLPNREVKAQETWKSRLHLARGRAGTTQAVDVVLTCWLEGTRVVDGRTMAIISLEGETEIRKVNTTTTVRPGERVSGGGRGQAHVGAEPGVGFRRFAFGLAPESWLLAHLRVEWPRWLKGLRRSDRIGINRALRFRRQLLGKHSVRLRRLVQSFIA